MSGPVVIPRSLLTFVVAFAASTCSDGTGPPDGDQPGVTVLAGATVTDTVDARLAQALVVAVRDSAGRPTGGMIVRFQALMAATPFHQPSVYVGRIDAAPTGWLAVDTTDDRGRARALIALGPVAGPGGVEVTVPELGYTDTAAYAILPGHGVRLLGAPEDTVVCVGASYALRGGVLDRYGNDRPDPVSFVADSGHATVTAAGSVTGATIGQERIRMAAAGGLADTLWATVAPRGTVAAVWGTSLVTMDLDGSHFQTVSTAPGPTAVWVDWNATGDTLVFASSDYDSWLYVTGLGGPVRRLISTTTGLQSEYRPQFSGDGRTIYFGGRSDHQNQAIWRVRPDGANPELIGPPSGYYDIDAQPAPSADGLRVAYLTNRCCYPNLGLRVLHAGTGAIDSLAPSALSPRWSPGDSLIGFVDAGIWVIRPDGSGRRLVSAPARQYLQGFDWSPSGEWIVAVGAGTGCLEVIRLSDGLTLTLRPRCGLTAPSWRP